MPLYQADVLTDFTRNLFIAAGVPAEEADRVSRSLVDANLCGHDSHGVMRVPQYLTNLREGKLTCNRPLEILTETPAMLSADASWGLGQVQAYRLLDRLLPKAKSIGLAAGTLRRCGHTGRLGEYAEWAAKNNLAFLGTVNSHGSGRRVAPPGGTEGRISTNPLCVGAPTPQDPVVLDIGTSAVAEGKVRVYFQKKEAVPEGWLLDSQGQPTTDPATIYDEKNRGSILPFGGSQTYKGFGLGLLLDLLAGGLSGGECSRAEAPLPGLGNSVLFVLFNIEMFGGIEHFLFESGKLTDYVRACPTAPGVKGITLPGDPERLTRIQRLKEGITIPIGTWELLVKEADRLQVPLI
ncbi:Ldh family oxidoreductase [Telmatocola sphagniphila]|uniref:Ldh family oxidoreductase n=1 Tax=Telmatocola sphagniphila TaxID=1123043 RepID=A0A8E6BB32_9BACT|nr:Ldh family oxidoreductase [Telmatocola sphagniphila]QVL33680.1 Ldh family oxidoreductase [Telmatocola sphagniphila]